MPFDTFWRHLFSHMRPSYYPLDCFLTSLPTISDNSSIDHHIPTTFKRSGKNDESYDQADSVENDRSISQGLVKQARLRPFGSFELPARILSIGTSPCPLVYSKTWHLPVMLEQQPLWTMKLWNMDASLPPLERKYKLLVLMAWRVHAYKSERLYKKKGNDAKAVGKLMQCLLTHFDATHSVIFARVTNLQSVF